MTATESTPARSRINFDSIGLDFALLEHKASELLAEILVVKESRDRGQRVSSAEIRDVEGKAKFVASLAGILRMKIETLPSTRSPT